jgi:hypothetical protein
LISFSGGNWLRINIQNELKAYHSQYCLFSNPSMTAALNGENNKNKIKEQQKKRG